MFNIILGFVTIVFGVILELLWLSICFGTIIIGLLVIHYKPYLLVSPFFYFLDLGNSILYKNYWKRSRYSGFKRNRKQRFQYYGNFNSTVNQITPINRLDKYYQLLESKESDSLDIIKSRYRKLIKKYHYDTTSNKDLSEVEIKYNKEKTLNLNEAYSEIKKARSS